MDTVVVKIGGSTLGEHDTSLDDLAALWRRGLRPVVVHGGGALISSWLSRLGAPVRFHRGQRVTDAEALQVVTAVLAGLVNKELVASLQKRGVPALGLSGADGGLLRARVFEPELGLVGEVTDVDADLVQALLGKGLLPVVAPIALEWESGTASGRLLNVNADLAAGAVAAALGARLLVLLTDVPGVLDDEGRVRQRLTAAEATRLMEARVIDGGMVPKVEACLRARAAGVAAIIVDGRQPGALLAAVGGQTVGTVVE
ncbi:MAG: acetylglutamate kinase [Dehalococcoidia bacterium]|mgnify:CR=1 FL=1|jgi:acetylglutamate kinase|nr:acetylglutamate kinase [Dehalococcoidia bacterium]MDW8009126.1 acetylglutamate kinase [Chloroflexota bacterium]